MKKVFGLLSIAVILFACSDDKASSDTASSDAPKKENVSLPYTGRKNPRLGNCKRFQRGYCHELPARF